MQVCYFFAMPHRERQPLHDASVQNEEVYDCGGGGDNGNITYEIICNLFLNEAE